VQLQTVHTALWPHCLNKSVFNLNWPYDSPRSLRLGGRLFQTCGPMVAKVLSPKRLTTSVRVSAERSCLTRASATSWQLYIHTSSCLLNNLSLWS